MEAHAETIQLCRIGAELEAHAQRGAVDVDLLGPVVDLLESRGGHRLQPNRPPNARRDGARHNVPAAHVGRLAHVEHFVAMLGPDGGGIIGEPARHS